MIGEDLRCLVRQRFLTYYIKSPIPKRKKFDKLDFINLRTMLFESPFGETKRQPLTFVFRIDTKKFKTLE